MTADDQRIRKTALGPALRKPQSVPKIICYDHNTDKPQYPLTVFQSTKARKCVDGFAFHLYGGNVNAFTVHDTFRKKIFISLSNIPDKALHLQEIYRWAINNLIIGATKNSSNVWNKILDPNLAAHTDGGCTTCLRRTVRSIRITRNQSYYIIAHAFLKFVRPGSVRVLQMVCLGISSVAFVTPGGQKF